MKTDIDMENGSRYPSEKTKAAIAAKLKGHAVQQQTRDRISASLKKWYADDSNFPNDAPRNKDYIGDGDVV